MRDERTIIVKDPVLVVEGTVCDSPEFEDGRSAARVWVSEESRVQSWTEGPHRDDEAFPEVVLRSFLAWNDESDGEEAAAKHTILNHLAGRRVRVVVEFLNDDEVSATGV